MSVQLVLKNSSVQDKEATAAQLAVGELALNYHSSGPFLQCEDSAGNIWRLGGVVIASTAPSSPSKGAWWLDSDDNHLYFYDGSSWIEIQTGEIVPGDITEGTARQLLQTNAAGNGTEWTSNIDVPGTLDVTGVATFDNNVVITGNLTVNGTTTTIDTTTLVVEDKNIEMGAVGTPTDSTADGGGITLKGATDKTINWVNATDAWTSSERFSVPLGAQGTPSLTFTGDANTGIYSPGADQVAISTGGSGRLFVAANGYVGVNTASPDRNLHIYESSTAGAYVKLENTDGAAQIQGNNDSLFIDANTHVFRAYTGSAELARITSDGKVGVGTSSPTAPLTIVPPANSEVIRTGQGGISVINGGYPTLTSNAKSFGNNADFKNILSNAGQGLGVISPMRSPSSNTVGGVWVAAGNATADTTYSWSSMTPALTWNTAGNVGVGTTSPSRTFHVSGVTTTPAQFQTSQANLYINLVNSSASNGYIGFEGTNLSLWNGGNSRLNIDSSGRVGIGTSSPGSSLHVIGSGKFQSGSAGLQLFNVSTSGTNYPEIRFKQNTVAGEVAVGFIRAEPIDRSGGNYYSDLVLGTTAKADQTTELKSIQIRNRGDVNSYLKLDVNGSNAIHIDGNQRVGIGTTSPGTYNARLALYGSTADETRIALFQNGVVGTSICANSGLVFGVDGSTGGTERARIDNQGRLLVGTSSALSNVKVGGTASNTPTIQLKGANNNYSTSFSITNYNINSYGPAFALNASRGSESSPAAVVDNGDLGFLTFNGYDGTNFIPGAHIAGFVDGTPGTNDMPGRLVFSTTADGASSPTERVRIEASGKTKFSGAAYGVENTITASAFDLNSGNLWTCGSIQVPNPTNAVAGLMGSIRVTAAPVSFGGNFDHPGGSYTAPTSFPAVAPFYCVSSTNILLGSWTEGIA